METHDLMGGKVHVYKRDRSRFWQCSTFLAGKNWRVSTKEESLSHAKEIAEDWYLELRGKSRAGQLAAGPKFKKAADLFLQEYETITQGQRSRNWIDTYGWMLRVHIVPFFGNMAVSEINSGTLQEYRIHRRTTAMERINRPPSRSSLHHEIVAVRQVLKTAVRHRWLEHLPDLSEPYRTTGKVIHRAWFSPEEYKKLYEATRRRAQNPKKERFRWECEQLHDYVLFLANTGLRPDEAKRLEYRDVKIVKVDGTNERILEIEVRGKRGVGYCKSMPGAVLPFRRLQKRNNPQPTDRLFSGNPRELLNTVLDEESLKLDRDGQRRTAYSLRHTYICFRLMEGADIYQIAKNCRTSVEMIEKYYAVHIKTALDVSAINVRRARGNGRV
ncbi:MAG TPA: site-specific integrase [Xanthobacteraceae bacterium]